jgi:hypothetical protein
MKTMAVTAIRGIWIPCQNRLAVDTLQIPIIGMARRAFFDDPDFIPLPWSHFVDVCMTVFTLNVIDKMGARIMFCPFLLVTSMASNGFTMNPASLRFYMGVHIGDVPMATIAGIGSMDGLGELSFTDLGMATEAFRVIDAFIAVFPALDDKFFSLWQGFWRLGDRCWLRALFLRFRFFRPKKRDDAKERQRDDE